MTNQPWMAQRISGLPPYLFAQLDRIRRDLEQKGVDVIDLGVGDPDLPTSPMIVECLAQEIFKSSHHRYPPYGGTLTFRKAVSLWYEERFGVSLDPTKEVLVLIGSKEGIAHAPLAFVDPGNVVLVPNIAYPVYAIATSFAGGLPYLFRLDPARQYCPVLDEIPRDVVNCAKMLFFNYPNNPTGAVLEIHDFERIVAFARRHGLLVCHDAAYSEVACKGYKPHSILEVGQAKECALEFHSLSKTFNMTGWRIGFVVGNSNAIEALGKVKANIDSGVFSAIQEAGVVALTHWRKLTEVNNCVYDNRRNRMAVGLKKMGLLCETPKATFYLWCHVPEGESSSDFCSRMLEQTGVVLTPGIGFGPGGEGFFRISLTAPEARLEESLARLSKVAMA